MHRKFNIKAKASGRLLKEKKGLTLVELVVAIAILGIVVSPILHAFTTSQTIENKARKLSEATDAAQNIQEVIDSVSVSNFLGTNDSKSLLGYDSKEKIVDEETGFDCAIIRGLESGKSTYDAKVVFGTRSIDPVADDRDAFNIINQTEIADFGDPDGTFAQPYIESANPDNIAETYFKTATNNKTYTQKVRDIIIDVTREEQDDGTLKIFVNVTFKYTFTYLVQETDDSGIGTGKYRPAFYEKDIVYSAIPAGATLHKDGSPLSCYVMYFPQYGTEVRPARDIITINNLEDIPIKLLIVKQWPLVKNGDVYEEIVASATREGEISLENLESGYKCEIKEYHSATYDLKGNDKKMTYTNARINLANDTEISGVSFKVYSGFMERARTGLIKDGNIVSSSKRNRLYDVAIYIYKERTVDTEEPIAKIKAAKAN